MSKLDDIIAEIKAEDLSYDQLLEKCATLQIESDNQASTILSLNSVVEDLQAAETRRKEAEDAAAAEAQKAADDAAKIAEEKLTKSQQDLVEHESQFKEAPRQI